MKTVSVKLPETLDSRLTAEARGRRETRSLLLRRASQRGAAAVFSASLSPFNTDQSGA